MNRPLRPSTRRLWPVLAVLAATSGCAAPETRGPARPEAAPAEVSRAAEADLAQRIHAEANAARTRAGREPLRHRRDLAAVALQHARDMAQRDYLAHLTPEGRDPEDRARAAGIDCRVPAVRGGTRVGVEENLFQTWIAINVRLVRRGPTLTRLAGERPPGVLAREVVSGWLASPGHRRTLLNVNARAHGIGVAIRPDSAVFVAQVLC